MTLLSRSRSRPSTAMTALAPLPRNRRRFRHRATGQTVQPTQHPAGRPELHGPGDHDPLAEKLSQLGEVAVFASRSGDAILRVYLFGSA
jgi:hypothetical protein